MGNKIIFLNMFFIIYIYLLGARFIAIPDLTFKKIASSASQNGSSGSDLRFHTRPLFGHKS